jgi:hypothetical protein
MLPTSIEAVSGTIDWHGGPVRRSHTFPNWISTALRITAFFSFLLVRLALFRAHSFDQIKVFSLLLLARTWRP